MIVTGYQILDGLRLTPLAPEAATQALQQPGAMVWLDVQAYAPDELETWLDKMGIKGLSRRLCVGSRDRSGFYPLQDEIFMVIPVLIDTEVPRQTDYVTFLCRKNLLLTFHLRSVLKPQDLATLKESHAWLPERSIAALVAALMIDLSLACLWHTTELRRAIVALEERMDRSPDSVDAEEILDLRAELLALEAVVDDQLPPVQALSVTNKPFFKLDQAREFISSALANLKSADSLMNRLDKRVSDLRSGFGMHAQDKTNRRLNMLTVLSAIFMPITLLAGIWGMNFEQMPELNLPFGYPLALGLMGLIGGGMYLFFHRNRWLD